MDNKLPVNANLIGVRAEEQKVEGDGGHQVNDEPAPAHQGHEIKRSFRVNFAILKKRAFTIDNVIYKKNRISVKVIRFWTNSQRITGHLEFFG
jgi:hypothetical protein